MRKSAWWVAAGFLAIAASVAAQSHVRYLAHSGYAGADLKEQGFDGDAFRDARGLARLGDRRAQFNLAAMYHVRGEHSHAAYWYRKAALFRHPLAAYNLGLMYYHGEGVEQSFDEAYRWIEVAAKAGLPVAQLQLGIMIYRGEGTEPDPGREASWYQRAAEAGQAEAQYNLSVLYSMGEGVDHDLVAAYAWMQIAVESGVTAEGELNMLESLLSGEQRAAAESRVEQLRAEIKPRHLRS